MKKVINLSLLSLCLSFYGCINIVSLSKGNLSPDKAYSYSYFVYFTSKTKLKHEGSCKVFVSSIKQSKKTIEKIVFYNCETHQPFKVTYTYNNSGALMKKDYFICVNDATPAISLSESEQQLLKVVGKRNASGDYSGYKTITGFREATEKDSLQKLSFLKDVENSRLN